MKSGLSPLNRLGHVPRVRLGAVVAVALAAAFVVWLVVRDSDHPAAAPAAAPAIPKTAGVGPVAQSLAGLKRFAAAADHPIYWAGPKTGKTYELVQTTNGRVYIRYLPPGVVPGAKKWFLTVATYPYPGAFASLSALAKHQGGGIDIGHGGIALVDKAYPKSVHLAYPGVEYEVEVFSPSPALSRRVVVSGQVTAIR
ncbi:MAG TPA: hypothetical protein VGJ77_21310 [Gaiellaceae bacterium]